MIKLRKYQEELLAKIALELTKKRKLCVQLATGGGKTVIFSAICKKYIEKSNKSILILVHRKELMLQTQATLYSMYNIKAFLIKAGTRYIPQYGVYIGMIESVFTRVKRLENIGMVIIDEAHIGSFHKIHDHFIEQYILGFTATPISSNKKKPLNLFYDDLICGVDIPELIALGFLSQNITRSPKNIVDRKTLKVKNGKFDDEFMGEIFKKPKNINNTVEEYKRWCIGQKTIIFNVNVSHNKAVCDAFLAAGYKCLQLSCYDSNEDRRRVIDEFKNTPNGILCNVGIFTAGFDEPTIKNVIINKATLSLSTWLQSTGRGARVTENKNTFNIIDMAGNAITHGDWSDVRDWKNIFLNPNKSKNTENIAPVKTCPKCDGIVHASLKVCKLLDENDQICGYIWPEKKEAQEKEMGDFIIITKNINPLRIIAENENRKDYFTFFKIGEQLANDAKKTIPPPMDDVCANKILEKYLEYGKIWAKAINEKRENKITFNQWHKNLAENHLFTELEKKYTEWKRPQLVTTPT